MLSNPHQSPSRASQLMALIILTLGCSIISFGSHAENVTVALSQEQNGGEAGRACIYVYQGKAEFRRVKADESCPAEIVVDRLTH
ncbi:hypothetical protein AAFN90_19220 [Erwiniaceae bacterium CAU 1747]